ncbi:MAG: LAGLIDADG family homing endonuclease [bacterium]
MLRQQSSINQLPTPPKYNSKNKIKTKSDMNISEWIKCRSNPLYFILNYCYIEETGGAVRYTKELLHPKLRRVVKSTIKYHSCLFMASRQLGKALDINTPIPTANGTYKYMKDIEVGDYILDGNGKSTKVIETTEIMYDRPCYEIEFDNGEIIRADENHLWKISNRTLKINNQIKSTKELFEIKNKMSKWKGSTNSRIELPDHIEYFEKKKDLLIHPYLLGLWLGDGVKDTNQISCYDEDYITYSNILTEIGYDISDHICPQGPENKSGRFTIYNTRNEFRLLNLFNNKHIPDVYLQSSVDDRLELLRGLMDSDGYCMECGTCQFDQKDSVLFIQVRQLLSSLGIKTRYRKKIVKHKPYHQLTFTTDRYYVFHLSRKKDRQNGSGYMNENRNIYIKSIKKIPSVPVRCIQVENKDGMFLCSHSMIPTHNSTIAACLLSWSAIFYPRTYIIVLNFQKKVGFGNLAKIRFVLNNLPSWMRIPETSKSVRKTYIELQNGSKIDIFYPSTTSKPETLARSLTAPILYIDEAAFINNMAKIYGSAQQTLATARLQAIKNNYPYYTLITSTPNGTVGAGEWFYKRWNNALTSDVLFEEKESGIEDWKENDIRYMLDDPKLCNSFIKIKYHWSEDPTKDDNWYAKQCQELDDKRMINQELDLMFVGTQYCIFDDDVLLQIKTKEPEGTLSVPPTIIPNAYFDLYKKPEDFDPMDYYLVGIDTASSMRGAYNAIEVFTFRDFNQIIEFNYKIGSLNKYAKVVDFLFRWLKSLIGNRIILCFENNSIGKAPIEDLLDNVTDIDYRQFIYTEDGNDEFPGIKTTGISKEFMIGCFIEYLKENPASIKSQNLYDQLSSIERTHSGNIQSNTFTDMFMSACFCAMVRKRRALEIAPLLGMSNSKIQKDTADLYQNLIKMNNPKNNVKKSDDFFNPFQEIVTSEDDFRIHEIDSNDYKDNLMKDQISILSDIM